MSIANEVKESLRNHTSDDGSDDETTTEVGASQWSIKNCLIIQFRGDTDAEEACDPYAGELIGRGFTSVVRIPVLKFDYINLDKLRDHLYSEDYSGLVLTSQRAVGAIVRTEALSTTDLARFWNGSCCDSRPRRVFCVGPKTLAEADIQLGLTSALPNGRLAINSEQLATLIIGETDQSKRSAEKLLMPCSSIARETLPQILSNAGIPVHCLPVYETKPAENFEEKVLQVLACNMHQKVILVFFSPSNVRAVANILRRLGLTRDLKFVAIGPTTSSALRDEGFEVLCTSTKPTPFDLAEAICQATNKTPSRLRLESWLNKSMKVEMTDGRTLVGVFLCTDNERNIILGNCLEYLKPLDDGQAEEPRTLGLAMVPGKFLQKISVDDTKYM